MPTATYDLIASNVLSTSAASVTFSALPSTYRDLVIVITASLTAGTGQNQIRLNSDTAGNYSSVSMEATGTAQQSGAGNPNTWWYVNFNNGDMDAEPTTTIIHIMDYAQTNKHKVGLSRGNSVGSGTSVGANVHRWASTSAVDTILIQASGTYAANSSFYVYGIAG